MAEKLLSTSRYESVGVSCLWIISTCTVPVGPGLSNAIHSCLLLSAKLMGQKKSGTQAANYHQAEDQPKGHNRCYVNCLHVDVEMIGHEEDFLSNSHLGLAVPVPV